MACDINRVVCELDAETGERLRIFSPQGGVEAYGIALSSDGNLLAIGWDNGYISVWDLSSGEMLHDFSGHTGIVLRLAFNQDGTRLASAGFDGFAKVWDVQTGQEVATLYGTSGNVFGVSFDGNHLATAGGDGTARIYTLDTTELVDLAHSRLTRGLTEEECQKYLHLEQCPEE
jgi:WD40 repeat protein